MENRVVAKVVVVGSDNKILLLKRSETNATRPGEWDIPGGHKENGEFAEEAAVRECNEEAGITIPMHSLRLVYAVSHNFPEGPNVTWLFFLAMMGNPAIRISEEHTEYQWKSLDETIATIGYERQKQAFMYLRDNKLV